MIFRMLLLVFTVSSILFANNVGLAEKVIIKKSTRMLYLSSQGEIYKKYHITLGQVPEGAKEFEGDMKTPEGIYWLDWRQSSPQYYKSIHISYPNKKDQANAQKNGLNAGGMIMLHGTPTNWSLSPLGDWMPMLLDWTEGCIAMSNDDLEEVWEQTINGTPIIIVP